MPYISKINVGGTVYDIKDKTLTSAMQFMGRSQQTLVDGGTQDPTKTSGTGYAGEAGEVWLQGGDGQGEFVWTGSSWELLGDEGSYVVKGSSTSEVSYTPEGDVSQPTFTGTTDTVSLSGSIAGADLPVSTAATGTAITDTHSHTFTGTTATISANASYQPAGTISKPTITITDVGHTHGIDISETAPSGQELNYTPSGSVSAPAVTTKTFTGTTATITSTASYTPEGEVELSGIVSGHTHDISAQGTANVSGDYQPAGTVSKPDITLTSASKTFVTGVTAASGTSTTVTVSEETLNLPISVITAVAGGTASGTDSVNNVTAAALATAPAFTGTTATISLQGTSSVQGTSGSTDLSIPSSATFTGTAATITSTASYQPAGSINVVVAAPTFTGDGVYMEAFSALTQVGAELSATPTFTGTTATITATASYQPAGTLNTYTWSKVLAAALPTTPISATGTFTPQGTVSKPTFTGTAFTHSHTV